MNKWMRKPLSNFTDRITYGFTNPMPTVESGPFMITAKDINGGRILFQQARRTSQAAYDELLTAKSRPKVGDVLLTKDGSLGRMAIVDRENICINQSVALLRPNSEIRPRFLKYLLEEPRNFSRMLNDADGSTIKHIYVTRLAKMEVSVPDLAMQDSILKILGTLDDKIDLNEQINATLEAMAHAIFRDWFVDFGPVRRKATGETDPVAILGGLIPDPEKAAPTAALFPDGFADDGLPDGWKEIPLDQVADFLNGLALQKYPAEDGEPSLPVIKIAELRNGITEKSNRASLEVPSKYIVQNGDFIFSWSGSLMAKFWTEGEGALNQHLFKVTSENYPRWFYSEWVHFHLAEFQRIAASKAVTMGHIKRSHLTEAMTNCPPADVIAMMHGTIDPLVEKQIQNEIENQMLAETRDYLLPRLMSGQVTVAGIESLAN